MPACVKKKREGGSVDVRKKRSLKPKQVSPRNGDKKIQSREFAQNTPVTEVWLVEQNSKKGFEAAKEKVFQNCL